ncbi:MAG: nitroreductase family protein, partial [Syntrophobacterales bacterium]|nr:nitroreductase family protein [Syntrophobacterales bacterium]
MASPVFSVVDSLKCTGCGLCERVCPAASFRMENGKAVIAGAECFACGHCMAVCSAMAVTVPLLSDPRRWFKTFSPDPAWLSWGEADTGDLVRLLMSRRSCRHYTDQPVDREQLLDLIKIAATAPSGRNVQPWSFTVIPSRGEMIRFGQKIMEFYEHLNRVSEKAWLRTLLKWCGNPQLSMYYEQYHDRIAQGIEEWKQNGRDRIFH